MFSVTADTYNLHLDSVVLLNELTDPARLLRQIDWSSELVLKGVEIIQICVHRAAMKVESSFCRNVGTVQEVLFDSKDVEKLKKYGICILTFRI